MKKKNLRVKAPKGNLGILMPGMGSVATTFIAGVEAVRRGLASPVGSLTQMGTIRLGKRTEGRNPKIKEFIPLATLEDLVFGGWDVFPDNCYESALNASVIDLPMLNQLKDSLSAISPMRAVFDHQYVKRLKGTYTKHAKTKMDLADLLMEDIARFKETHSLSRMVMVWCGSTEVFMKPNPVHNSLAAFERGLKSNSPHISPSMIYAYAAIKSGVPFANGAPNLTLETRALVRLSLKNKVPVCGKDFKTGQTLLKTILAPGLKSRLLGLEGWFSTNILGNRDGEVLDDPDSFRTKEKSKL